MTLGKMKPRFKTKKVYLLSYRAGKRKRRSVFSSLSKAREIARHKYRNGAFISLKNGKGIVLPI